MNIEFIIPTYNRPITLIGTLHSLLIQNSDNYKIHIISDGKDDTSIPIAKEYENTYPNIIRHSIIDGPNNDWGHTARIYGINNAVEDWTVMTGDDNYYTPIFVKCFTTIMNSHKNVELIYCNMLHNNNHYHNVFETELKNCKIDMGCFAMKTEILKKLKYDKSAYDADGLLIEDYIEKYGNENTFKLPYILYVHN